ncbi:MAG: NADH-quinone oxidoreductase subunit, partial [Frankiales bacterium]|nr:NADH-quinone oxidoreductase subunit [Frankiales bacterium]
MPTDIQAPSIAYVPLLPMLIVFGAATVGVLVEAFVPAAQRRLAQVLVAVLGLAVAFGFVVYLADHGTHRLIAESAIAIDGPTLFLQGTLCLLGIGSIFLLAERKLDQGGGEVVSQASHLPGSREDLALADSHRVQTEIYPLAMFALGGMLLF